MLVMHNKTIGWTIVDLKDTSSVICSHKILLEEGHGNLIEAKRRLNPTIKQVVMKEIINWLDTNIIFSISNSLLVSSVQCSPKKGGMTMVSNENDELIPNITVTCRRVCMEYHKLNKATRKDHLLYLLLTKCLIVLQVSPFIVSLMDIQVITRLP
ncbi:hypothetical protein GQ457_11G024850 [Hibiscus cannabinus]